MENIEENISENTSGKVKNSNIPTTVLKKFNWGALVLNWVWALRYKPITAIILIVLFCIKAIFVIMDIKTIAIILELSIYGYIIWMGINGNKWAWQKYHYKSEKEFHMIQQRWAKAIIFVTVIPFIIGVLGGMIIPSLLGNTEKIAAEKGIKADINAVLKMHETPMPGENGEEIAKEFAKNSYYTNLNGNMIEDLDGAVYAFNGNGMPFCKLNYESLEANCTVTVDLNGLNQGPNQIGTFEHPKDRWRYVIGEKSAVNAERFLDIKEFKQSQK